MYNQFELLDLAVASHGKNMPKPQNQLLFDWLTNFAYWIDPGCYVDNNMINNYLNSNSGIKNFNEIIQEYEQEIPQYNENIIFDLDEMKEYSKQIFSN